MTTTLKKHTTQGHHGSSQVYQILTTILFLTIRVILHVYHCLSTWRFHNNSNKAKEEEEEEDAPTLTSKVHKKRITKCCVIGGGPSGIAALKHLTADYGDHFKDCILFECRDQLGGIWNYSPEENVTPMYDTLHTNTSKHMMSFSDFPMPSAYPDYPSRQQVLQYLQNYVKYFQIEKHVRLNTKVVRVERCRRCNAHEKGDSGDHKEEEEEGGGTLWRVVTQTKGESETREHFFDAVFIGNGHLSEPHMPQEFDEFASTYKRGTFSHSKQFTNADPFQDKKVVIVGVGSSGADIAAKITPVARETIISVRPTADVKPKYVWGMPTDQANLRRIVSLLPRGLRNMLNKLMITWQQPSFGTHLNQQPSLNSTGGLSTELLQQIGDGVVRVAREIDHVTEDRIHFVDGTSAQPDFVVCCTGYEPNFPFLDIKDVKSSSDVSSDVTPTATQSEEKSTSCQPLAIHLDRANGRLLDLYKHVFHMEDPSCCFIGIPNRIKPFPVIELQVRWCCEIYCGNRQLPNQECMRMENARKGQQMKAKGIQLRFWHRVNHLDYCEELSHLAGCHPDLTDWNNRDLLIPLLMHPLYPSCYRISGTKNGGSKARHVFLEQHGYIS